MKAKIVTLSLVFMIVVAAGRFYAKPVLAQVRAALVQNVDEPGRNPYQEQYFAFGPNCANGSQFCNFNYAAVPAGKRLVVTNISGYVDVNHGTLPNGNLESSLGGGQYAFVAFTGVRGSVTSFGSTRFFVNQEIHAYFGPGEVPHGFEGLVSTGDTFAGGAELVLTGYYINLP